jgi:hypothetical protein
MTEDTKGLDLFSIPEGQPSIFSTSSEIANNAREHNLSEPFLVKLFNHTLINSINVINQGTPLHNNDIVPVAYAIPLAETNQKSLAGVFVDVVGKLSTADKDITKGALKDIVKENSGKQSWLNFLSLSFRVRDGRFVPVISINQNSRPIVVQAILEREFHLPFDVGADSSVGCLKCGNSYPVQGLNHIHCPNCNSPDFQVHQSDNPAEGHTANDEFNSALNAFARKKPTPLSVPELRNP